MWGWWVKIFSYSVGCLFVFLTVSFALQKLLSFRRSHLLIVALSVCATGVLFRKWSPVPILALSLILITITERWYGTSGLAIPSTVLQLFLQYCWLPGISCCALTHLCLSKPFQFDVGYCSCPIPEKTYLWTPLILVYFTWEWGSSRLNFCLRLLVKHSTVQ